jgi:uncharacterized protein YdgA (DUF945 family)
VSARRRRAVARTTVTVAILLGCAWYTGKLIGQHRRARRQMGVETTAFTYPIRPSRTMEVTA